MTSRPAKTPRQTPSLNLSFDIAASVEKTWANLLNLSKKSSPVSTNNKTIPCVPKQLSNQKSSHSSSSRSVWPSLQSFKCSDPPPSSLKTSSRSVRPSLHSLKCSESLHLRSTSDPPPSSLKASNVGRSHNQNQKRRSNISEKSQSSYQNSAKSWPSESSLLAIHTDNLSHVLQENYKRKKASSHDSSKKSRHTEVNSSKNVPSCSIVNQSKLNIKKQRNVSQINSERDETEEQEMICPVNSNHGNSRSQVVLLDQRTMGDYIVKDEEKDGEDIEYQPEELQQPSSNHPKIRVSTSIFETESNGSDCDGIDFEIQMDPVDDQEPTDSSEDEDSLQCSLSIQQFLQSKESPVVNKKGLQRKVETLKSKIEEESSEESSSEEEDKSRLTAASAFENNVLRRSSPVKSYRHFTQSSVSNRSGLSSRSSHAIDLLPECYESTTNDSIIEEPDESLKDDGDDFGALLLQAYLQSNNEKATAVSEESDSDSSTSCEEIERRVTRSAGRFHSEALVEIKESTSSEEEEEESVKSTTSESEDSEEEDEDDVKPPEDSSVLSEPKSICEEELPNPNHYVEENSELTEEVKCEEQEDENVAESVISKTTPSQLKSGNDLHMESSSAEVEIKSEEEDDNSESEFNCSELSTKSRKNNEIDADSTESEVKVEEISLESEDEEGKKPEKDKNNQKPNCIPQYRTVPVKPEPQDEDLPMNKRTGVVKTRIHPARPRDYSYRKRQWQCPSCKEILKYGSRFLHLQLKHKKPYLCPTCPFRSRKRHRLRKHILLKHRQGRETFDCEYCHKSFCFQATLNRHINTVHAKGLFALKCIICDQVFRSAIDLGRHRVSEHPGEKPFRCQQCEKSYTSSGALKLHMLSQHQAEKPYACVKCNFGFTRKDKMEQHMNRHFQKDNKLTNKSMNATNLKCPHIKPTLKGAIELSICDLCGGVCESCSYIFRSFRLYNAHTHKNFCALCIEKFPNEKAFKLHIAYHEPKDVISHRCEICKFGFVDQKGWNIHSVKTHRLKNINYPCEICEKSFTSPTLLLLHKRTHEKQKAHKCPWCKESFITVTLLHFHLHRKHTQERHYQCTTCKKGFVRQTDLTRHLKSHGGDELFQCNICDRKLKSNRNLQLHLKIHDKKKSFLCEVCGKGFAQKCYLKLHNKLHEEGGKPYPCGTCEKSYLKAKELQAHLVSVHGFNDKDNRFSCEKCHKVFVTKQGQKKHSSNMNCGKRMGYENNNFKKFKSIKSESQSEEESETGEQ